MSQVQLAGRVGLGLAVLAMLLARYQPLFRLVPQPLQDQLWRAAPAASAIAFIAMLTVVLGLPAEPRRPAAEPATGPLEADVSSGGSAS